MEIEESPSKQKCELQFWKKLQQSEGVLKSTGYKQIFTKFFPLDFTFYEDKSILDIGCGPRGSLEWATHAKKRVCVDPLANEYAAIGATNHTATYIVAGVESIPLPNSSYDVISSINNLDHVTQYKMGIKEICRILKPGGIFLLIVEIHAEPTPCEPLALPWNMTREFNAQGLVTIKEWHYETGPPYCKHVGTTSANYCPIFNHTDKTVRDGFMKAIFKKGTFF